MFVPSFFVETGMRLRLDALQEPSTWLFAITLGTVIILAKGRAAAATSRMFAYSAARLRDDSSGGAGIACSSHGRPSNVRLRWVEDAAL